MKLTRKQIDDWIEEHYPDGCAEWRMTEMLKEFQDFAEKEASCSTES